LNSFCRETQKKHQKIIKKQTKHFVQKKIRHLLIYTSFSGYLLDIRRVFLVSCFFPRFCCLYRHVATANVQGASPKKKSKTTTDRLSFLVFFFNVPLASAVGRLRTCHRMRAPAAGCGGFLYELVPSDDPFMWCLCDFFVLRNTFFQRTFFFLPSNK
jgi:hypothetical protein